MSSILWNKSPTYNKTSPICSKPSFLSWREGVGEVNFESNLYHRPMILTKKIKLIPTLTHHPPTHPQSHILISKEITKTLISNSQYFFLKDFPIHKGKGSFYLRINLNQHFLFPNDQKNA